VAVFEVAARCNRFPLHKMGLTNQVWFAS